MEGERRERGSRRKSVSEGHEERARGKSVGKVVMLIFRIYYVEPVSGPLDAF